MRPADTWKDYELLDATDGNRLERWGETILIRPDPQVVWKTPKQSPLWAKADAVYHRCLLYTSSTRCVLRCCRACSKAL